MATKQSTQLCYQVNGGTCRNKVSAKNSYICAAGHRAIKNMGSKAATPSSVEAVAKMGKYAQRGLAMNPMIGADVAQALFDIGDRDIKCNLARNPSIDRDMAQALFDIGDRDIKCNLATNPSIDRDMMQALFDIGDDWIRCNLARNPSIDRDMMQALFDTGGDGIRYNLATNPSINADIAQALFDTGDYLIRYNLAKNPSIDREMAIKLAKDEHQPIGYLKNKSITELCERENISLLNEHPEEFGRAYLDHLLGSDEDLDQMKALLCYSYDCYRKASGSNPKGYRERILAKYPNDEEIKYLLSGD